MLNKNNIMTCCQIYIEIEKSEREINLHKSCDDQTLLYNFLLINLNHVVEQQQKTKKNYIDQNKQHIK